MKEIQGLGAFHNAGDAGLIYQAGAEADTSVGTGPAPAGPGRRIIFEEKFSYDFKNFFHPFVADVIKRLNQTSIAGMLDPVFLASLDQAYGPGDYTPLDSRTVSVTLEDRLIDVSASGPYAHYNWELLYHIPVMIGVHLSNNQRFAEAQKWFHLVFDPASTDISLPAPERFWKSFVFRDGLGIQSIDSLLALLSTPNGQLDPAQIQAK